MVLTSRMVFAMGAHWHVLCSTCISLLLWHIGAVNHQHRKSPFFIVSVGSSLAKELQVLVWLLPTCLNLSLLMTLPCTPPGYRPWSQDSEFISCASQWGLTVSIRKTKAMAINSRNLPECLSLFPNVSVKVVGKFPYLGSVISGSGSLDKEASSRLSKNSRAFGSLLNPIFQCPNLSITTKRIV